MKQVIGGIALGVLALGLLGSPLGAQSTIDTYPDDSYVSFGYSSDPAWGHLTVGQTIRAGTENVLDRFTFTLDMWAGTYATDLLFRGYVMAWQTGNSTDPRDGALGPVLYQSAARALDAEVRRDFTFETGGLTLSPGAMYVLFLSTKGEMTGGISQSVAMQSRSTDVYAEGQWVNAWISDTEEFHQESWSKYSGSTDLALRAEFSSNATVTPEPLSMALLGTGLAGIGVARRRRRKKEEELV